MTSFSMAPRVRRRIIVVTAALAMSAVLAGISVQVATAQASPARGASNVTPTWTGGAKPVIVLEHGAWADASQLGRGHIPAD
jgi:hypothetical protein